MSEITPAYRPLQSCLSPSSPDRTSTTAYPRRSKAARKNAMTDGSSSISRIGCFVESAGFVLIRQPLLQRPRPKRFRSRREFAPRRCSHWRLHCSNTESHHHALAQSRSKCSIPVPYLCQPAWSYKTDRKFVECP